MKKYYYVLWAIVMAVTTCAFAQAACVDEGDTLRCGVGVLQSIDYKGNVVLDGTTILDELKVMGDFTAKNAIMNHIDIVGDVTMVNSVLNGNVMIVGDVRSRGSQFESGTKIVGDADFDFCEFHTDTVLVGDLNASQTLFRGPLSISTNASYLTHSVMNELTIKKQNTNEQPIIYLKEGSVANVIHFPGGKGLVELSGGSHVLDKVIGGKTSSQEGSVQA
ncbi:MAG: hypothetical protein P4M14_13300 [Gammaproteobacteria bacterium]|nr:hypothetical protein [Gammaproteobacteria bacterium]